MIPGSFEIDGYNMKYVMYTQIIYIIIWTVVRDSSGSRNSSYQRRYELFGFSIADCAINTISKKSIDPVLFGKRSFDVVDSSILS